MSICFLLSVLNLVTPSRKRIYLTDCLLWSLTVISQWHIVGCNAVPLPKDECYNILIHGYFSVLGSWWWNSMGARSGNTSSCCVLISKWFWQLFHIACHRFCAPHLAISLSPPSTSAFNVEANVFDHSSIWFPCFKLQLWHWMAF